MDLFLRELGPVEDLAVLETNMRNDAFSLAGGHTFWIVEDDETVRLSIIKMIESRETMKCKADFYSMEQVLMQLRTCPDVLRPEILLVDVSLPGMSGLDGIISARSISPDTRVIVLTNHEDPEKIRQAFRAGAAGYLLKSQVAEELPKILREMEEDGMPLSSRAARHLVQCMAAVAPVQVTPKCHLSSRESEVLGHLVDGHSKREIAGLTNLSVHTVNTHLRRIYDKLQVNTNTAAVATAIRQGLV